MAYTVYFQKEDFYFQAQKGMTILDAQIFAELEPDAPCGGNGTCGKCWVLANGKKVLACKTAITCDMTVITNPEEPTHAKILSDGLGRFVACAPGKLPENAENPLLAAVDLGSTSVVGYLMDGKTGECLQVKSMLNPQRQYGADVVMRSSYALEHGAEVLSGCIRQALDGLLRELAEGCGHKEEEIVRLVMVGNSCMHHLFLEIPVDTLVVAPYEPRVKEAFFGSAIEYGLHIHKEAKLIWLPNIGGFVGADTVGCILAAEFDRREKMTLLVDIGTNGEMVLGNRDGYTVCSTAAGPAFEGAKITCGMRGNDGAIDHVSLADGKLQYHVIGESEPKGICGSGLLDAVWSLLQSGQIDETGRMEETYYFTQEVFLSQKDVRELQLAKAAIAAGVQLLCRRRGVQVEEIQEVLLAGAFGNYLDPKSACGIGLLPPVLEERILPVGNAAGEGARLAALSEEEFKRACRLASRAEFLELALDPSFQDVYVDELSFDKEDFYGSEEKI